MKLSIWTDGGARGNPGPAGIGVVIKDERGEVVLKKGKFIGWATNNEAEYQALIFALDFLASCPFKDSLERIDFYSDSALLVNQMKGKYKVKANNLKDLFFAAKKKEKDLRCPIEFRSLARERNSESDFLVNQALDQAGEEAHDPPKPKTLFSR